MFSQFNFPGYKSFVRNEAKKNSNFKFLTADQLSFKRNQIQEL